MTVTKRGFFLFFLTSLPNGQHVGNERCWQSLIPGAEGGRARLPEIPRDSARRGSPRLVLLLPKRPLSFGFSNPAAARVSGTARVGKLFSGFEMSPVSELSLTVWWFLCNWDQVINSTQVHQKCTYKPFSNPDRNLSSIQRLLGLDA